MKASAAVADPAWLSFYDEHDVRVKIYGEPERLVETECAEAIAWIRKLADDGYPQNAYSALWHRRIVTAGRRHA